MAGLLAVLLLGACGDDGGPGRADPPATPVEVAQEEVESAQQAMEQAQSDVDAASARFCEEGSAFIEVLDRYGRILDDAEVTVGDVSSGVDDLAQGRDAAGSAAEEALEAHEDLDEATAALAAAQADLAAAQAALGPGPDATSTPTSTPTTTTEPLVPTEVTDRVVTAEEAFAEVVESVDDQTPVAEATVAFSSAAFAVEAAWLQLVAAAGCLDDQGRSDAVSAVAEYTRALQTDLQTAGFYSGAIDGIYGPATVAAIEGLQAAAGLPITGLLDPPTEQVLAVAVEQATGSALAGAATHTAAVQGALKVLGYWDGPVDGAWSPALSDAVSALQEDLGLEPTGTVDTATLRALEDALADPEAAAGDETATTSAPPSTAGPAG